MVRVWDMFVRAFHWCVAALFATAYVSADWRTLHLWSGYIILVLLAARLIWGVTGPRYARFGNFLKRPATVIDYVRKVIARREPRYLGHNPAGGAMIAALFILLASISISGVLLRTDLFWGSEALQLLHGLLADTTIALLLFTSAASS